uniref:C3H1-type domain-containing protein n=1 Tax=Schizophyllum commune (strain H4-8 / FGSC 9210) TaxID=578458 RepID=D8PUY8_SCHCM
MTAIEAPWRVKTRPCPFYQQGKCLFAESCNFLHNVQIKVPGGPTVIHASPPSEVDVRRTPEGPAVIVDSPHSYRSPPRSPRMNNLLDALKGVIREDEDVDDADDSEERPAPAEDVRPTPEAEPPTEPDRAVPDAPQPTNDAPHDPTTPAQGNVVGLHQDREQSPECEEDSPHSTNSAPTPDILSPVELSHLRLSGLDQLSHAKGNNSFDSGYAEQWQSPRPFALSPPRSPSVVSTFGLLSSPFGSPSERVFGSPLTQRFSNIPPSPLLTASLAQNGDGDAHDDADVANLEDDLDSPNAYRASVASSMTMEAATDVTEDLSFEAGEGSGVTDLWDTFGQPTAMYSDPQASPEAPEEEEDVVDAYGQSPAMHIGPEHGDEVLFEGDASMDSSFDSITAKRISFSDVDAQSTFHGPIPQRSPLPSHEEPDNESWVAQEEPATPMPEEHDIITDYEHMESDEGDLSDDTIDLHAEGDTTEYTAVDDTISSFGQAAPGSEVDDTISSFGQAAEPPAEDATWSSFGHTGHMSDDTAELAYDVSRSPSPTVRPGENDTLQNLYDHYSVASSPEADAIKRSSLDDIPETSHTALDDGEGAEENEGAVHLAEQSPALTARSPALTERNIEHAAPSPSPPQDADGFTIDDYAVEPPSPATELDELMADVAHVNQATPPTPRDAGISPPAAAPGPSPHASLHSIEYVADALTPESLHSREVETPPYDDYYDLMSPEASDPPQPLVQDDAQHTPAAEDVQHTPMIEAAQHSPVTEDAQHAPVFEAAWQIPAVEANQSWPVADTAHRSPDIVQHTPVLDTVQHSPVVEIDERSSVAIDAQQAPVVDEHGPVSPVTEAQSPPQAVDLQQTPVMEVASFMLSAEDPFAAEPVLDVQSKASEDVQSTPQVEDVQLVSGDRSAPLASISESAKSPPVSGDARLTATLDDAPSMPSAPVDQPATFIGEEQATPSVLDAQSSGNYLDAEPQGHSIAGVQSPPADEVMPLSPSDEDAHLTRPHSVDAEADQGPSPDMVEHFASLTPISPHEALAQTAESTPPLSVFDAPSPSTHGPSDSIASSIPRDVVDNFAQQTSASDIHGIQSPSLDAETTLHEAVEDEDYLPPPPHVEQHVEQAPSHTHDDGAALSSATCEDGASPEVLFAKALEDMARSTPQEMDGGAAGPGLHEEAAYSWRDFPVGVPYQQAFLTSNADEQTSVEGSVNSERACFYARITLH